MAKRGRPRSTSAPVAGVYYILNERDGCLYIGSSVNVAYRIAEHRSGLRTGKHPNKRLQAAWKADGADAFVFSLLTEVKPVVGYTLREVLEAHEGFWMEFYRSDHPRWGYNERKLGRTWLAQVFDWGGAHMHKMWDRYWRESGHVFWQQHKAQSYYVALPPYRRSE